MHGAAQKPPVQLAAVAGVKCHMNQMKIALLASLYSSLLGAFVIAIEFILIFLAFDSKPEVTMGGIGLSFFYYFMTVVVCFFLAFVFGSPIYKVLRIYSFANFGSSATIGIIFI